MAALSTPAAKGKRREAKRKTVSAGKAPKNTSRSTSRRSSGASRVGEKVASIDRRRNSERRTKGERRSAKGSVPEERRKLVRRAPVNRRRQIDPTTCERDYTPDEIEFMNALDDYKRRSGRMFPTCSEVLEVVKSLGYAKTRQEETGVTSPN